MKRIISYLAAGMLCFAISCSKSGNSDGPGDPGNPGNPNPPGQEQPAGEGEKADAGVPDGTPKAEKVIGAAGGTLTSNDGKVKITVPAGALSTNQTIGIQRISNTNPLKTEHAYRLTPHGQTFAKPVEIAFPYDDALLDGTPPQGMGIAYQDGEGRWVALPATVNTSAKTITVASTHFSDWAIFHALWMYATMKKLPARLSTLISVYSEEDLLAPLLTNNGKFIRSQRTLAADQYITKWTKIGAGTLTGSGSEAYYTAPAEALPPPQNPATISIEYRPPSGGVYMLMTEITTVKGFIEVRINDGAWIKLEPDNANFDGNIWSISSHEQRGSTQGITFFWRGGKGSHHLDLDANTLIFTEGGKRYVSNYMTPNGNDIIPSPGSITITDLGEQDFFVDGTFIIQKAGLSGDLTKTVKLEGKFSVVRSR